MIEKFDGLLEIPIQQIEGLIDWKTHNSHPFLRPAMTLVALLLAGHLTGQTRWSDFRPQTFSYG